MASRISIMSVVLVTQGPWLWFYLLHVLPVGNCVSVHGIVTHSITEDCVLTKHRPLPNSRAETEQWCVVASQACFYHKWSVINHNCFWVIVITYCERVKSQVNCEPTIIQHGMHITYEEWTHSQLCRDSNVGRCWCCNKYVHSCFHTLFATCQPYILLISMKSFYYLFVFFSRSDSISLLMLEDYHLNFTPQWVLRF